MKKIIALVCAGAAALLPWKTPMASSASYSDAVHAMEIALPQEEQPASGDEANQENTTGTAPNQEADNESQDDLVIDTETVQGPQMEETQTDAAQANPDSTVSEEVTAEETLEDGTQSQEEAVQEESVTLPVYRTDEGSHQVVFEDLYFEDNIPGHIQEEAVVLSEAQQRMIDWKAEGSFGFFDYYDSRDALKVLNDHTNISAAANGHNAVSWSNFKASMQYIRECNQLRAAHGLPALRVSDAMMAIAEVQANASAATLDHSRLYSVNENLAWGMKIGAPMGTSQHNNPFDYWYYDEKAIYDRNPQAPFMDVAHYLNIIKPTVKVTGFAVNSMRPGNRTMFCQVFTANTTDKTYSLEEYENRIRAYEYAMENGEGSMGGTDVPSEGIVTWRLFNPNSSEHFYTQNENERSYLISLGWQDEGIGWIAGRTGAPVYRLYNPNAGDHHYTLDTAERQFLIREGWQDEGIGWYAPYDGETPVYRQYNPNAIAGAHNFTANPQEASYLISLGWIDEGTAFSSY